MAHRIEIKEGNVVEIFNDQQEAPMIRQPQWPSGDAWADSDEARSWAEMYIESIEIAEAPFAPMSPGGERKAKPTPEEVEAMRKEFEERYNTKP